MTHKLIFIGKGLLLLLILCLGALSLRAQDQTVNGNLLLGVSVNGGLGYGPKVSFDAPYFNTDFLWMSRFNRADNATEFRVNLGDDLHGDDRFVLGTNAWVGGWYRHLVVRNDGKVIIGAGLENEMHPEAGLSVPGDHKLYVSGGVLAERVQVSLKGSTAWPDYVFAPDYALLPLPEVEKFVHVNRHLPGMPTARQVEAEGVNLGETQSLLLKKVEELTLYLIEQQKQIQELKQENRIMKTKLGQNKW